MTAGFLALSRADNLLLADALERERGFLRANGLALPETLQQLQRHCSEQASDTERLGGTKEPEVAHLLQPAPVLLRTLDETAEALRLSRKTVERLVAAGRLPTVSIGSARRVRQRDLDAFVAGLEVT